MSPLRDPVRHVPSISQNLEKAVVPYEVRPINRTAPVHFLSFLLTRIHDRFPRAIPYPEFRIGGCIPTRSGPNSP